MPCTSSNNILFEIRSRQKQGGTTILLVDDIADSFDYKKNKYAIIEYLKDISHSGNFFCLFLLHNFDFYRSISGRLKSGRPYKLMASKSGRKLCQRLRNTNNQFIFLKSKLAEPPYCISAIPFVRNLAEYCGHSRLPDVDFVASYEGRHRYDYVGRPVCDLQEGIGRQT